MQKPQKPISKFEEFSNYVKTGTRYFTFYTDIILSPAYQVLSLSEKALIMDMFSCAQDELLSADHTKTPIKDKTFSYTYGDCRIAISSSTFYISMRAFVRVGFITNASPTNSYTQTKRGKINKYKISEKWRDYKFTEEESEEYTTRMQTKRDLLTRNLEHLRKMDKNKEIEELDKAIEAKKQLLADLMKKTTESVNS